MSGLAHNHFLPSLKLSIAITPTTQHWVSVNGKVWFQKVKVNSTMTLKERDSKKEDIYENTGGEWERERESLGEKKKRNLGTSTVIKEKQRASLSCRLWDRFTGGNFLHSKQWQNKHTYDLADKKIDVEIKKIGRWALKVCTASALQHREIKSVWDESSQLSSQRMPDSGWPMVAGGRLDGSSVVQYVHISAGAFP